MGYHIGGGESTQSPYHRWEGGRRTKRTGKGEKIAMRKNKDGVCNRTHSVAEIGTPWNRRAPCPAIEEKAWMEVGTGIYVERLARRELCMRREHTPQREAGASLCCRRGWRVAYRKPGGTEEWRKLLVCAMCSLTDLRKQVTPGD